MPSTLTNYYVTGNSLSALSMSSLTPDDVATLQSDLTSDSGWLSGPYGDVNAGFV